MAEDQDKAPGAGADEPVPGTADEAASVGDYATGFESLAKFADPTFAEPSVGSDDVDEPGEAADDAGASEAAPASGESESADAPDEPGLAEEPEDALVTEAEQIAAKVASARPVRKSEPDIKGRATPKQERSVKTDERPRVGPITFVKQSIEELKKVNWPSLDQWQQYFIVVLVFVLIVIAYVGLLDLGFGALLLKIFGDA
ncbi:MAG: preprotein translocase subunit SecE [Micrococcales bacterium]|nr:preprotein translocase subunit SecE [Micrococcales bacterium]